MTNFQQMDTSYLLAKAQGLSSRIAAVNEIAIAINRSLNRDEILKIVSKQAKWLLDFEHLSVYLCGDRQPQFVTLFGGAIDLDQIAIAPTHSIDRALQSRQPQLIRNESDHFLPNFPSGIVVPLESQRQIIGTINFATRQAAAYTLDDLRIGYLLALQLGSAIANAERFEELNRLYAQIEAEKQKSDELLLNILPLEVATELKQSGTVKPVYYESASVLFADFKDFSKIAESMTSEELLNELNYCFSYFDQIIDKYNLEKLKTMGDGYMCVGGIPSPNQTHAIDTVLAALEMQIFMQLRKAHQNQQNLPYWDLRIGIHSGSLIAGVIGQKKFAYDVWGDTVNTAARLESAGIPGKINISASTLTLIEEFFGTQYRGKIAVKNKGDIDMYLITGIKGELSIDPAGLLPNDDFISQYLAIHAEPAIAPPFCQWTSSLFSKP
jgi:class 3 adenylate cyclase